MKSGPQTTTEGLEGIYKYLMNLNPGSTPRWVKNLPALFSGAGFEGFEADVKDPPPHMGFLFSECALIMPELIYRKTKNEEMKKILGGHLAQAVKDLRSGAHATATRWTVIDKKPAELRV